MPNLGPMEIFIIMIVALLVFGPKKLPEIGRSIGKGLREFKKASNEVMNTLEVAGEDDEDDDTPPRVRESKTDATNSSDRTH